MFRLVEKTYVRRAAVVLALLAGGFFSLAEYTSGVEQKMQERKSESIQIALSLLNASDYMSNEVRQYAAFAKKSHVENYFNETNKNKTREVAIYKIKNLGVSEPSFLLLESAKLESDKLMISELAAIDAINNGNIEEGRSLIFSLNYNYSKSRIEERVARFRKDLEIRTENVSQDLRERVRIFTFLANISVVLMTMGILFLAYGRLLIRPEDKLSA